MRGGMQRCTETAGFTGSPPSPMATCPRHTPVRAACSCACSCVATDEHDAAGIWSGPWSVTLALLFGLAMFCLLLAGRVGAF
jgi:hypothetical protein